MLSLLLIILLLLIYLIIYNLRKSETKITEKKISNCICGQQLLTRDNNIPGILPGGIPGDTLGLEHNPELNLFTRNPLFCKDIMPQFLCGKCDKYNGSYRQCTNNYLSFTNNDINRYLKQQF